MGLIITIIGFIFIWRMINKSFDISDIAEEAGPKIEDELSTFDELYELYDVVEERRMVDNASLIMDQVGATHINKMRLNNERRDNILSQTSYSDGDELQVEVIEEAESEVGGIEFDDIHRLLHDDLRTVIMTKEILEPKYNTRR